MAEGDAIVLNNFKEQLMLKTIDCVNDTFKVALYSVAVASPDGAAPAYTTTNEIVASGYVAGPGCGRIRGRLRWRRIAPRNGCPLPPVRA